MSLLKGKKITSARGVAMIALFVAASIGLSFVFNLATAIHQKSTSDITVIYSFGDNQAGQTLELAGFELNQLKHQATLKISLQTGTLAYILMFLDLLLSVAYVVVFFLTAKIFHRVDKGDPFSPINQTYLHIISWILLGHGLYTYLREYFVTEIISNKFSSETIVDVAGLDPILLIGLGTIISAFAYIFKEGHRIYEEQKLTV